MAWRAEEMEELARLDGESLITGSRAESHSRISLLINTDEGLVGLALAAALGEPGAEVLLWETNVRVGRVVSILEPDKANGAANLLGGFLVQAAVEPGSWPWMEADVQAPTVDVEMADLIGRAVRIGTRGLQGLVRIVELSARIRFAQDGVPRRYDGLFEIELNAGFRDEDVPRAGELVMTGNGQICGIAVAGSANRLIAAPCRKVINLLEGRLATLDDIDLHNRHYGRVALSRRYERSYSAAESAWQGFRRFEELISANSRRLPRYRTGS